MQLLKHLNGELIIFSRRVGLKLGIKLKDKKWINLMLGMIHKYFI